MIRWWSQCGRLEGRLGLLAAGALDEVGRRTVEAHLAGCLGCRQRLRQLERIVAVLETDGGCLPQAEPGNLLRPRWRSAVLATPVAHPIPAPGREPAEASVDGWRRGRLFWGTVSACWLLAALFHFSAPDVSRPALASHPVSLRDILLALKRDRPGAGLPAPVEAHPKPRSNPPFAPSPRSEGPNLLETT